MKFRKWKIKILWDEERPVHKANCHLNFAEEVFELYMGTKEDWFKGKFYTTNDLPLLIAHEKGHAQNLIDGIVKPLPSVLMTMGNSEATIDRLRKVLKDEYYAWKRAFQSLPEESLLNLDWIEKAQDCMNVYVFAAFKMIEKEQIKRGPIYS